MSVFFNGRLYVTPTTVSAVNDSALANQAVAQANAVAILGPSAGGAPNTPLVFGTPTDAINALISGDLLTAVLKAFNPSPQTGGPSQVTAIRVNPALQSTLILNDASVAPAINLTSVDFGVYTTGINVSIAAGSVQGVAATVALGNSFFTQDNLFRSLLQIQYTGSQASATMTVNGSQVVLDAPAGTPVATLLFANYTTVQALVGAINAIPGFLATAQGGNGGLATANGFDYVTAAVDVKTAPYNALAVLQATIDWFNSGAQQLVSATRAANAGLKPAVITGAYLTGGSDGTITNTNWANGYSVLQTVDVQWVVPATGSTAIIAMNDAHCQFMSTVGQSERRGICGLPLGTTDMVAETEAFSLNSDRTGLVHIGHYDFNASVLTLYPAYFTAALVAGGFAGSSPGTPMTNKTLTMRGLERTLQVPTQTDPLINAGVMPIAKTASGFKVIKSISTWLTNSNFNRVELSTGAAVDYTARSVRAALDILRGQEGSPTVLAQAASITDSTLRQLSTAPPTGPGVLVGNAASPPYKNIQASLVGDAIAVQFQASPVIPVNYVLITIYAVPFSGSISA